MQLPKHFHNELRDGFRFLAPHERRTAEAYWSAVETSLQKAIAQAVDAPVSKAPAMQRLDASDRREAAAARGEFLGSGGA
jgi:hypothetical protein